MRRRIVPWAASARSGGMAKPPKAIRNHLTLALEEIIRRRIMILELLPFRDERQEGELIAFRQVLFLASTLEP